ncbi:MAG TPA: IS110 family transposase [Rubrivivax sp.]|jgi:transposase|nr:IS110 family transposase [Rubrivivax sp.]
MRKAAVVYTDITELHPVHDRVAALDVHLNQITVCVMLREPDGQVRMQFREFGGFKRDRREMAEWIASFQPQAVSMESTGIYWKSPYAALERVGIRAQVVNAAEVAKTPGRKTDMLDAQWLALLTRAGLLRGSFLPVEKLRHARQLARYHTSLVNDLVRQKNRLLKVLADGGMRLSAIVSDPHGKACRAMIDAILDGASPEQAVRHAGRLRATHAELRAALDHELTEVHLHLARQIRQYINFIEASMSDIEAALMQEVLPQGSLIAQLLTLPGIDRLAAAKLLVEIGDDMRRFAKPGRLAVWTGVCPGNEESAGNRKRAKTRKGNCHARRVLIEIAHAAVKTQCYFKDKFQSLKPRLGYKRAIVAIAHKIIKVIYCMLSRGELYRDRSVDFEALQTRRNAPRWIRQLQKHGVLPANA